MIPYGKQNIDKNDISSVIEVMQSDYLTQGPITPKFEKELSAYCGAKHAVAVVNATSALHLSCLALGVGKGDIVWTSPISFVASANCAKYCDAEVDFVDIDMETYNISIEALQIKLSNASKTGKLPKVLIPVHLAGRSCDMKKIKELSIEYGFKIIEDASQAFDHLIKNRISFFHSHGTTPEKIVVGQRLGAILSDKDNPISKLIFQRNLNIPIEISIHRNTAALGAAYKAYDNHK